MGPSGAGKSTLLYALMGLAKYGKTTGRVWVNERAIPLQRLRRIVGYVPQVHGAPECCKLMCICCAAVAVMCQLCCTCCAAAAVDCTR